MRTQTSPPALLCLLLALFACGAPGDLTPPGVADDPTPVASSRSALEWGARAPYEMIIKRSGKCVDVEGASTSDGAQAIQWPCGGQYNQRFFLTAVTATPNYWIITSKNSNKCLTPAGNGTGNGTKIVQWGCWGATYAYFRLYSQGDGTYTIVDSRSGRCLDVNAKSTADGVPIQLWDCNGGDNQRFRFNLRCLNGDTAVDGTACYTLVPWNGQELGPGPVRVALQADHRSPLYSASQAFPPEWIGIVPGTDITYGANAPQYRLLGPSLKSSGFITLYPLPGTPYGYPTSYKFTLMQGSDGGFLRTDQIGYTLSGEPQGTSQVLVLDTSRTPKVTLFFTGYNAGNYTNMTNAPPDRTPVDLTQLLVADRYGYGYYLWVGDGGISQSGLLNMYLVY